MAGEMPAVVRHRTGAPRRPRRVYQANFMAYGADKIWDRLNTDGIRVGGILDGPGYTTPAAFVDEHRQTVAAHEAATQ
jgi:hypothetical protein